MSGKGIKELVTVCKSKVIGLADMSTSKGDGNKHKKGGGGTEKDKSGNEKDKDLYYFTVDKLTEPELIEAKKKKVEVNGESLALISHEDKIYAIQDKCPHYGGPLHQGDIEDVPPEGACVRCPWHSWKFSLSTGKCVSPQRDDKILKIYPVRVVKETKEIKIGFESISEAIFNTPP